MLLHLIASALTSTLGAPSVVSISDDTSTSRKGGIAGVSFSSAGMYSRYINDSPINISNWLAPQTNMSQYEIRATVSSGSTPDTGTIGSWETLDTLREWTLTNATPATTDTSVLLIEIRWTGDNTVQDSATYTLNAVGPLS